MHTARFLTTAAQLHQWTAEVEAPASPVAPLPITAVVPKAVVDGPAPQFADQLKALYQARHQK